MHIVHNLILLDESGSMESIKRPTIQSFNEIIQTAKGLGAQYPEQQHLISLVSFNGLGRKTHLWSSPVQSAQPLDDQRYTPDASTPLYDCIGYAASRLSTELHGTAEHNVLVTIFTDGEENASVEWSGEAIKALVEKLQGQRWTFTYIGTDHDVSSSATRISITNTIVFDKSAAGIEQMMAKETTARSRYAAKIRAQEDTKDDFYNTDPKA